MAELSVLGILLAATSQHGLPSLCQCWKHQALLVFLIIIILGQAARHRGSSPALLGREGGCSQPAQRPARGPGLPIPAVPLGEHLLGSLETLPSGSCHRGVSHAAEGGSLARLALATTRPPRAAVTVTRGTGTGCPQGVASPAAGCQPYSSHPALLGWELLKQCKAVPKGGFSMPRHQEQPWEGRSCRDVSLCPTDASPLSQLRGFGTKGKLRHGGRKGLAAAH